MSEEDADQFRRCHQESKDNFVKAFSGFGCSDVQVYHKPDYEGFQKIFDGLTDFYYSHPDKKKVLLFAYCGQGQISYYSCKTEAVLDTAEKYIFPLESLILNWGGRPNFNIIALLNCGRER